jgi:8-oxo-dGTP pyrophosphatase MutT (NUDIX family)
MAVPHADQPIRPASTVCVLRRRDRLQVLMVERARGSAFVGGAFVFPGGAVDDVDRGPVAAELFGVSEMAPYWSAAVRETFEEAGVVIPGASVEQTPAPGLHGEAYLQALRDAGYWFDPAELPWLSNWVTPRGQPRRFDTRFFVAAVHEETEARPDLTEVVDALWVAPSQALENHRERRWRLPPPTLETLQLLGRFEEPTEVVALARSQVEVPKIAPRMRFGDDGTVTILMPGDPGYDEVEP